MKSIFGNFTQNWRRLTSLQKLLVVIAVALTTLYGGAKNDSGPTKPEEPVTPVTPVDPTPVTPDPVTPEEPTTPEEPKDPDPTPDPDPETPTDPDPEPVAPEEPEQGDEDDLGLPDLSAAQTYNGYLCDAEDAVVGTIQVKAAKATTNRKTSVTTSKLTISIQVAGEKKVSARGEVVATNALFETTAGGRDLSLRLGANRLVGTFGDYEVVGVRDVFSSKAAADKETANAALAKWQGAYSIVADGGVFSLTVAAKGKVKFSGTLANGKKASATAQLLVDDASCCIPVVVSKTGVNIAFVMIMDNESEAIEVLGMDDLVACGVSGALEGDASFSFDVGELCELLGDDTYDDYLPVGLSVVQSGTKWIVEGGAKAGKVVLGKDGEVDEAKAGANPSALKLTYKVKDGSFTGSFKAYVTNRSKPSAVTVSISGVVIDGMGYGTATVKKSGSVSVTIGR